MSLHKSDVRADSGAFLPRTDRSLPANHALFGSGCLQVDRLIGSAPGELRLGAKFSVLATSQPNSPLLDVNAGNSSRGRRPSFCPGLLGVRLCSLSRTLTRGHRCEPLGSRARL